MLPGVDVTLQVKGVWCLSSRKGLPAKQQTDMMYTHDRDKAKRKAFDLLDALTRSGALALEGTALHVVLAAYHCFGQNLVDTVRTVIITLQVYNMFCTWLEEVWLHHPESSERCTLYPTRYTNTVTPTATAAAYPLRAHLGAFEPS